jgi:hypothetical protein
MFLRINIMELSRGVVERGGQCKADGWCYCGSAGLSGKAVKWVICPSNFTFILGQVPAHYSTFLL